MKTPVKVRNLPHEQWMEAYQGYYVSNMGRWYSERTEKVLKQEPNSSGYYRVSLWVDGKQVRAFTHIKVVELFGDCNGTRIPENNGTLRELHLSIDHLNRDKRNNRQSNLELVSHRENCARKYKIFNFKEAKNYGKRKQN